QLPPEVVIALPTASTSSSRRGAGPCSAARAELAPDGGEPLQAIAFAERSDGVEICGRVLAEHLDGVGERSQPARVELQRYEVGQGDHAQGAAVAHRARRFGEGVRDDRGEAIAEV